MKLIQNYSIVGFVAFKGEDVFLEQSGKCMMCVSRHSAAAAASCEQLQMGGVISCDERESWTRRHFTC